MFALAVALALTLPVPDSHPCHPDVRLSDAREFGVSKEACRALWRLSTNHATVMREQVLAANSPAVFESWECECRWRAQCWDALDDAVVCTHLTAERRLMGLERLRSLIGEEMWARREMPNPTPSYRLP